MKTIMLAAVASLILVPAAFAAAPMVAKAAPKPVLSKQTEQGASIVPIAGGSYGQSFVPRSFKSRR